MIINKKKALLVFTEQVIYSVANFTLVFSIGLKLGYSAVYSWTAVFMIFNLFCILMNGTLFTYINTRQEKEQFRISNILVFQLLQKAPRIIAVIVIAVASLYLMFDPSFSIVCAFLITISIAELIRRFFIFREMLMAAIFCGSLWKIAAIICIHIDLVQTPSAIFLLATIFTSPVIIITLIGCRLRQKNNFSSDRMSWADCFPFDVFRYQLSTSILLWSGGALLIYAMPPFVGKETLGLFLFTKNLLSIVSITLPFTENYFIKLISRTGNSYHQKSMILVFVFNATVLLLWTLLILTLEYLQFLQINLTMLFACCAISISEIANNLYINKLRMNNRFKVLFNGVLIYLIFLLVMFSVNFWNQDLVAVQYYFFLQQVLLFLGIQIMRNRSCYL